MHEFFTKYPFHAWGLLSSMHLCCLHLTPLFSLCLSMPVPWKFGRSRGRFYGGWHPNQFNNRGIKSATSRPYFHSFYSSSNSDDRQGNWQGNTTRKSINTNGNIERIFSSVNLLGILPMELHWGEKLKQSKKMMTCHFYVKSLVNCEHYSSC